MYRMINGLSPDALYNDLLNSLLNEPSVLAVINNEYGNGCTIDSILDAYNKFGNVPILL